MRRRHRRIGRVATGLLLGLTACGVPDQTDVQPLERVPFGLNATTTTTTSTTSTTTTTTTSPTSPTSTTTTTTSTTLTSTTTTTASTSTTQPVATSAPVPLASAVATSTTTTTPATTTTSTVPTTTTSTVPTTTTSTTSSTVTVVTATTELVESVSLYLVSTDRLRLFNTTMRYPAGLPAVLVTLLDQPGPAAAGLGLRTALPRDLRIGVRDGRNGIATVDLPDGFFERIATFDQRLAVGQIVLTLVERPGIGQVRFTRNGAPYPVPRGSGELARGGEALSRLDYLTLVTAPPTEPAVTPVGAGPTPTTEARQRPAATAPR